jgi:hypothetical protein
MEYHETKLSETKVKWPASSREGAGIIVEVGFVRRGSGYWDGR